MNATTVSKAALMCASLAVLVGLPRPADGAALSFTADTPPPAPPVASVNSANQEGSASEPPPGAHTTLLGPLDGMSGVGVVDGTIGMFWGKIPTHIVGQACGMVFPGTNIPVTVQAYDSTIDANINIAQVQGCDNSTSGNSVEGTQARFKDDSGRTSALNCFKDAIDNGGCSVYFLGSDIDAAYQNLTAAAGAGHRKVLGLPLDPLGTDSDDDSLAGSAIRSLLIAGGGGGATDCTSAYAGAGVLGASAVGACGAAALVGAFPGTCIAGAIAAGAVAGSCGGSQGGSGGGCFPSSATAWLCGEGGSKGRHWPVQQRSMAALSLGDEVLVSKPDGSLACEPIYAWGHQDSDAYAQFVKLTLAGTSAPGASNATATFQLELTPDHFVPVAGSDGYPLHKRARAVRVGDTMWVADVAAGGARAHLLTPAKVLDVSSVGASGLFNPFTLGGTIVVNGVLASAHSEWFADSLFDLFSLTAWLPAFYQAVLAPARLMWHAVGCEAYVTGYRYLDTELDFASICSTGGWGLLGTAYALMRAFLSAQAVLAARHSFGSVVAVVSFASVAVSACMVKSKIP